MPALRRSAHTDALLVATGRGDLAAFAALYDLTAPVVFGMLQAALGEPERAERATEEVYLHVWRDASAFDPARRSAWATVLSEVHQVLSAPIHDRVAATRSGSPPGGTA